MGQMQLHLQLLSIVAFFGAFQHASSQSQVASHFFQGNLGTVPISNSLMPEDIRESALLTLKSFLSSDFGALDSAVIQEPADEKVHVDHKGDLHIRYHHLIDGLVVEGAAMMMHIDGNNRQVYAINGEFAEPLTINEMSLTLDCEIAVNEALKELKIDNVKYLSECTLTAVYADDGFFHKAWKALIEYTEADGSYQRSFIFASLTTGAPLAVHPQIHGARSLQTIDCRSSESCINVGSRSSSKINLNKRSVTNAHNHAIDTVRCYRCLRSGTCFSFVLLNAVAPLQ
jgi:Zn-dependent metalloprotease